MFKILDIKQNREKLLTDQQLLLLSEKVVNRYVSAGTIPEKDKDDVKMGMVEKFLIKHDSIKNSFKGDAKITTYCIAVLNRMCCEIIRKELKHWKQQPDENNFVGSTSNTSSTEKFIINDEIRVLEKIIELFDSEKHKVRLFLVYFYQLLALERDIQLYDANYLKNKLTELFNQIHVKNKGEIFENLALAVQRAEAKTIKADAVRMWLNKSSDQIVNRLNGPFQRANYDKESLQILFEYYYAKRIECVNELKPGA